MNKKFINSLLALLALALTGPAAAETTLKIATIVPEGTNWMETMRAGSNEIARRTEGRVKFKFYSGGIQGTDSQVRRKMRIGQLHGGVFTSGALRAFQRDAELYGLPLLFRSYEEVVYVRERMDHKIRALLEDSGYVNFGFAGGGFAYLISNTPIRSRNDMSRLKIWIPEGDQIARLASDALGISAVTLPLTDVLTGLQTELIDTVMGPPVGVIVMQWHTAMRYITDLRIAYAFAALIIDARIFNRLSPPDQAIVREVMDGVYRGFDEQGITDDREAYRALLDEGLEPVGLVAEETQAWRNLIDASNRKAGADGVFDTTLLDELECYLEAFRTQAADSGCAP